MKLFASDFDGTLCFEGKVSEKNKVAIRKWRETGNLFIVVTGRSLPSIKKALIHEGIEVDYVATNNGGFLWDGQFQVMEESYFDIEPARDLLKYLQSVDATHLALNDGENRCIVTLKEFDRSIMNIESKEITMEEAVSFNKLAQIVVGGVSDEHADEVATYINNTYTVCSAYRNVGCIDIVPSGISKAVGVEYVRKRHNIQHEDVYTAGDANNDLPMLLQYRGMTLHSAHQSIKKEVKDVYEDVADRIDQLLQ